MKNFEHLADEFTHYFRIESVSRCDKVEISGQQIKLIEETQYGEGLKDLLDDKVFEKQVTENIKKMWGSFSILVWYLMHSDQVGSMAKSRVFILAIPEYDPRMARQLKNLMEELRKYRNGAFDSVNFEYH
jgi:hypothetical protein